jgi:DNA (cytosine-5)-methyltransferase 1
VAGDVVAGALDPLQRRGWTPYLDAREGYRLVYLQSHVRTLRATLSQEH